MFDFKSIITTLIVAVIFVFVSTLILNESKKYTGLYASMLKVTSDAFSGAAGILLLTVVLSAFLPNFIRNRLRSFKNDSYYI